MHNEECHYVFSSPDILKVIRVRRMRWVEHVACIREMGNAYRVFC
jgi:hypothetical protein